MAEEPAVVDTPTPGESEVPESGDAPIEEGKSTKTPEQYEADLAKARREAHGLRTRLREVEPLAKEAQAAAEAKKDDVQRATERAQAAEKAYEDQLTLNTRLDLAVQYHIAKEDIELIGSGTLEEMETRAKRVAALTAAAAKASPPPTDRPVEGLRPGASPEPASPPDDSYPIQWKPAWMQGNERESRIIHGQ